MTKKEYWLLKIAEESAELSQAALKIVYFGEGGVNPKDPHHVNNLHSFMLEHSQLLAATQTYLKEAANAPTWKALPYDAARLNRMVHEAAGKQAHVLTVLVSNNVVTE